MTLETVNTIDTILVVCLILSLGLFTVGLLKIMKRFMQCHLVSDRKYNICFKNNETLFS